MSKNMLQVCFCALLFVNSITFAQPPSPAGGNFFKMSGNESNYLELPLTPRFGNLIPDMTIEVWFFLSRPPSSGRVSSVVRKKMDDKTFAFFVNRSDFQVDKVKIGFETCKNGGMTCGAVQMDLSDFQFNQWHHLAWTHSLLDRKMSDYSFYIDGIPTLVGRASSEPDYFTSEGILTVGEGYFNGAIDELRISDEVIYKGQFRPPQRLRPKKSTLALWHFDEPMNSARYHDASGRSNTLFNSKFSVQPLGQLIFSWGNLKRL